MMLPRLYLAGIQAALANVRSHSKGALMHARIGNCSKLTSRIYDQSGWQAYACNRL
jgi:hypothetical protein